MLIHLGGDRKISNNKKETRGRTTLQERSRVGSISRKGYNSRGEGNLIPKMDSDASLNQREAASTRNGSQKRNLRVWEPGREKVNN